MFIYLKGDSFGRIQPWLSNLLLAPPNDQHLQSLRVFLEGDEIEEGVVEDP